MVVHLVEYMDKASRGFGQRDVFGVVDPPAAGENRIFNGEIGHGLDQGDSKGGPYRVKTIPIPAEASRMAVSCF